MPLIEVKGLRKEFSVTRRSAGLQGALRSLWKPDRRRVVAVDGIDFQIERGDLVGYIGPNGAGKSTTVKMLCGILHPTSGSVRVEGLSPHSQRRAVVRKLGVVFGQRTQLYWDLRLGETFELIKRIYGIDDVTYRANMDLMSEVLGIHRLLDTPVRQLSLGQRMRGDIVAAILHSPPILLLDEPTIGLDVRAKEAIREFILEVNRRRRTTILLTTHDLGDVEKLCRRLIVINHGRILEDAPLTDLRRRLAPHRILIVDFETDPEEFLLPETVDLLEREGRRVRLRFEPDRISSTELISWLACHYKVRDLQLREPEIDEVIGGFYDSPVPDR